MTARDGLLPILAGDAPAQRLTAMRTRMGRGEKPADLDVLALLDDLDDLLAHHRASWLRIHGALLALDLGALPGDTDLPEDDIHAWLFRVRRARLILDGRVTSQAVDDAVEAAVEAHRVHTP